MSASGPGARPGPYDDEDVSLDPQLKTILDEHTADGTMFFDPQPHMVAAVERDTFLAKVLPILLGDCVQQDDNGPYCTTHDSMWIIEQGRCHYVNDRDNFADSVIEAWEGRDRG
jgi:hypothetical protein